MASFGFLTTMMNHVAISLDRLNAIAYPMSQMSAKRSTVLRRILAMWVISAVGSSHQLIASYPKWPQEFDENIVCPLSKVTDDGQKVPQGLSKCFFFQSSMITVPLGTTGFFVPLLLVFYVYVKMFRLTRGRLKSKKVQTMANANVSPEKGSEGLDTGGVYLGPIGRYVTIEIRTHYHNVCYIRTIPIERVNSTFRRRRRRCSHCQGSFISETQQNCGTYIVICPSLLCM